MSTLREAAQQALEAAGCERLREWASIGPVQRAAVESFLQAALAQQEQVKPVEIKQPNPEGATQCIVRWLAETPAGWVGAWDREALERLERFTAHPPRREWQSLTEEEKADILFPLTAAGASDMDCARAIEAALRSKNYG